MLDNTAGSGQNVMAVLAVGATPVLNHANGTVVPSALDANTDAANSALLLALAGATDVDSDFSDNNKYGALQNTCYLSGLIADIKAQITALGVDAHLSQDTQLSDTGFVEKGNATGASPATTDINHGRRLNCSCSVVTLMGTGFA